MEDVPPIDIEFDVFCRQIIKRRLELNWFNENPDLHKVVLYDADPTVVDDAKAVVVLVSML